MQSHPLVSVNPLATMALSLDDEVAFWRREGFVNVGVLAKKMGEYGWEKSIELLSDSGLHVAYLIHGVYTPVTDDAGWATEIAGMRAAIDAAVAVRCPIINFSSGPPRHLRWNEALDRLAAFMEPVVAYARERDVTLTIENSLSSRTEFSFILTAADAFVAARQLGCKACIDLYTCWVERDLRETLRDNVDLIGLVQFADFVVGTMTQPNRWVPGDADLPLERLLADVLDAGYRGPFDIELIGPAIDAEGAASALRRGQAWLSERLAHPQ